MKRLPAMLAIVALSALLFACNMNLTGTGAGQGPPTASPESEKSGTATADVTAATEPPMYVDRIGIRVINGVGEFFNTTTDETFVPRGVNYVDFYQTERGGYEDRVLATNVYDPARVRTAFQTLAEHGYNTVRLFIDTCGFGPYCIGNPDGSGLNPAYLDNLADLMTIAGEEGIYLILTANSVPEEGGYWSYFDDQVNSQDQRFGFESYQNADWLHPAGVEIKRRFWQDLMVGMVERQVQFETVLGWQLTNELWLWKNAPPLSLNEGLVTISNDQTYNMADQDQKRQMVVDGLLQYFDVIVPIIKQADPEALTTVGFFAPQFPNPTGIGGEWYVDTAPLVETENPIDFWDFHAYYDTDLGIREQAENFGMIGNQHKPVVMGETGSGQAFFPSAFTGLTVGLQWIADSCEVGFDGWLNWGYYPWPEAVDGKPWTFLDQEALLLESMSPASQPDPCSLPELERTNIALGRSLRYSAQLSEEPATAAVDGSELSWSAGNYPPQWIEIELDQPSTIDRIGMSVSQWPPGNTHHRVWAKRSDGSAVLMADFNRFTTVDISLAYQASIPLEDVSSVRVETLASPSWVGWREVEVISAPAVAAATCLGTLTEQSSLYRWPGMAEPTSSSLMAGTIVALDGQLSNSDGDWWRIGGGAWLPAAVLRLEGDCDSPALTGEPLPRSAPVTFEVTVPENTTGEVFVAGSFPGTDIPIWVPYVILLQKQGSLYRATVELPVGENFEYAYTRGSFDSIERPASCSETDPRQAVVESGPMTLSDHVIKWNDLDNCR